MQIAVYNSTEPDLIEFEAHSLPCVIRRVSHSGHLCGYVFVPPGHPWYNNEPRDAEVHGGVTWTSRGAEFSFGENDGGDKRGLADWWVVGFDCSHSGDLRPLDPICTKEQGAVYRDLTYVRAETENLARQAARAAGPCTDNGERASCDGPDVTEVRAVIQVRECHVFGSHLACTYTCWIVQIGAQEIARVSWNASANDVQSETAKRLHAAGWRPGMSAEVAARLLAEAQ